MMGYLRPVGADAAHRALLSSYQCALCHHVGATYGFAYRALAGPDLVFYNLFLDVAGAGVPGEGRRACVLAPGVTRLRCRETTEHTRLAAAFGVWMAVAKLEDDWRDEGGALRWLAWRAFAAGGAAARATLLDAGFPVAEIEAHMRAQATVEAAGPLPLDAAAAPTAAIAALTFGVAPNGAAVGDAIGRYLFYMDNLLDYGRDVARGGYNALARAFPVAPELPDDARAAAVAGARAQVEALRGLLAAMPVAGERAWLARVLVAGFADKLRRWEALPVEARRTADLKQVTPRPDWRRVFAAAWARGTWRGRVAFAFMLAWAFPKSAWAERWWPEDTGGLQLDTGMVDPVAAVADTAGGQPAAQTGSSPCDWCAGNCGWVDAEGCCEATCGDVCGDACNEACGDACAESCSGK